MQIQLMFDLFVFLFKFFIIVLVSIYCTCCVDSRSMTVCHHGHSGMYTYLITVGINILTVGIHILTIGGHIVKWERLKAD